MLRYQLWLRLALLVLVLALATWGLGSEPWGPG